MNTNPWQRSKTQIEDVTLIMVCAGTRVQSEAVIIIDCFLGNYEIEGINGIDDMKADV